MSVILKPTLGSQLNLGHSLSQGLVGLWLFNEGTGNIVSDLSGNGNTGTRYGTGNIWTPGKFGLAQQFNGSDDYVDCGSDATLNPTGPFTISVWINPSSVVVTTDITSKSGGSSTNTHHIFLQISDDIRFYVGGVAAGNSAQYANFLVAGTWYNLVGVWDGTNIHLYIDGVLKDSASTPTAPDNSGTNFFLGQRNGGSNFYNGLIDLPMIYNRALSASEIAELYLRPFAMFDRMPIELWVGATSVGVPPVGQPQYYYRYLLQGVA